MTRTVAITLDAKGDAGCKVVDLTTGEPIPNIRKVTVVYEVHKPTVATIEMLPLRTDAQANATIVAPQVVEQILQDLDDLQAAGGEFQSKNTLLVTAAELEAVLRRRLGLES